MKAVKRGDDPDYFGPGGRVRAARLFPLPTSYMPGTLPTPGLRVLTGGAGERAQQMDVLYDQLADLIGQPDALDPDSTTGRRIAEIEAELTRHEEAEVRVMREAFDASLLLPRDAGAAFDQKLAHVLAGHADLGSDDAPAGKP